MNAPRLVSCYFGAGAGDQWPRLARVLACSAAWHCQGWQIDVRSITPAPLSRLASTASYGANTQKLDWWTQVILDAPDGDRVALLDADTMIVGALDPVWDHPFDLAYTARPKGSPFPLNAGVVFVRVTERSRAFMGRWRDENRRMLGDRGYHTTWRKRFGGINQAALGCLLTQGQHGAQLAELPCREWNCEDACWATFDPQVTRLVHVKSALRRALFLGARVPRPLERLAQIWRDWEKKAAAAEHQAGLDLPDALQASRSPGRPRLHPSGALVHTSIRIPQAVYDAYCRHALSRQTSLDALIRDVLVAGQP